MKHLANEHVASLDSGRKLLQEVSVAFADIR